MGADVSRVKTPEKVELPKESAYLLEYYYRLRRGSTLTYQELEAFYRVNNIHTVGFEVEALMNIDSIFEASHNG